MTDFPDYLRVVVQSNKKSLTDITTSESIVYDKIDVDVTNILAHYLGFVHELLTPADGELGRLLPNGNWTGMVKMVLQGEADLVVSILSLTEERTKILDFSYPYYIASVTFATRQAEFESDFAVFLTPFSFEIWVCTVMIYLIISTVLYMTIKKKYSAHKILLVALGTLLRQQFCIKLQKMGQFLLTITWILGAMFISYCYSAVLLSHLTVPPLSGVRTVPELAVEVAKGNYECTTYPGTFIVDALATSSDPYCRIIGKSLQQNKGSQDIDGVLKSAKSSKKPTFVGGRHQFMGLSTKYFVSDDEFMTALQVIWMRKDFCCKKDLNRFVSYLWSSGIYQKLIDFNSFLSSLKILLHPDVTKREKIYLTVDDLKGAFGLLIIGYISASLTLIFEIIISKYSYKRYSFPILT